MTTNQPPSNDRRRVFPPGTEVVRIQISGTADEVAAVDREANSVPTNRSSLMFGRTLNPAGGLSPAEAKMLGGELVALHQAMSALRSQRRSHPTERDEFDAEIRDLVNEARALIARIKQ